MSRWAGAIAAFLFAILATAAVNALVWIAIVMLDSPPTAEGPHPLEILWQFMLRSTIVIAIGGALLGLPFTALLVAAGRESWAAYTLGGFMLGTAFFHIMHVQASTDISWLDIGDTPLRAGLPAALFGLLWWRFGRRPLLADGNDIDRD